MSLVYTSTVMWIHIPKQSRLDPLQANCDVVYGDIKHLKLHFSFQQKRQLSYIDTELRKVPLKSVVSNLC